MDIHLIKAAIENSAEIREMQVIGFEALLHKYGDTETNSGAETLEKVRSRFSLNNVDQYFISLDGKNIGYIRIRRLSNTACRLSQMFILPDFQNRGYAQMVIRQAESYYPEAKEWSLDTIKQEQKLCHLYEKMGYKLTGVEKN